MLYYTCCIYSVIIFFNIMFSFGSDPLEKNQSDGVSNFEPLSKPVLDAISQVVVMAMEKHTHSSERIKKNEN